MKILYVSNVCGPKMLEYIFNSSILKPSQAVQKFHHLFVRGFSENSSLCTVEVLSNLPVSFKSHKKKWWPFKTEVSNGIQFDYIMFLNFPLVKHFFIFFYTFSKIIFWRFINYRKERIVICDILNVSTAFASFLACRLTGQKIAVIVTDLPVDLINYERKRYTYDLYIRISTFILHRFNYYIGLTAQMDQVINPFRKPFLVMEGLVDFDANKANDIGVATNKRILLYAGGIYEKYGVKNLIDAFIGLNSDKLELHIYGSGDLETMMPGYCALDTRIVYHGVVSNSLVVENLRNATLLINPRPTTEEFTKYSFPSKNMEYMTSGTPLLTTKLPGMPPEYHPFVYMINDETVIGIRKTLSSILAKPQKELDNLGRAARKFVIENKSNVIQAKKVILLFKKEYCAKEEL